MPRQLVTLGAMPFRSGSIAYARFRIAGAGSVKPPTDASQDILDALAQFTLKSSEVGEPSPIEFGWCGGRHVFDEEFAVDYNVFGRTLLFGLRIDTNRVPADIRRAYRSMSETAFAADNPTGFLSRRERQAAREDAEERCRQELASGQHRRSKLVEILWDLERNLLLTPVFSDDNVAGLRDLFFSTFDVRLEPVTSGSLALDILASQGRTRDYEDLIPSRFTDAPAGLADGDRAELSERRTDDPRPQIPWMHNTSEVSDFLGNEFLLWLWRRSDVDRGEFGIESDGSRTSIAFVLDRSLDLECAWSVTGKTSLQNGVMTRAPEALRALQIGKWPRKAGLTIATADETWQATLQGDRFQVSALRLERPKEDVKSIRELIEHRIESLGRFDRALLALFESFLNERAGKHWSGESRRISDWIARRSRGASSQIVETKPVPAVDLAESTA